MIIDRPIAKPQAQRSRLRLEVTGAVQGVGFRPFVHRLAVSEGLGGFVRNTGAGVSLEVEGPAGALDRFRLRLQTEIAPPAEMRECQTSWLPVRGDSRFVIATSAESGRRSAVVLPDLATCSECRAEILDPGDRRYRYPFTTCVHCGPRYSIIESPPYDRIRTSMRRFPMCTACRAEYEAPESRRFHAETNACPDCGPQPVLWDAAGKVMATRHEALVATVVALRAGRIVALKGLGGFQLLVDARNDDAVLRLRERKRRPAKPFAVMAPSLTVALQLAELSSAELQLLESAAAPIVLAQARGDSGLAGSVAPGNPKLGLMLPYTPLHHLLLDACGFAVVATSGNRSGESIVADETEALARLAGIADCFLVHDRPILRPVDDSVVRVIGGRATTIRHARGYAPQSFAHPAATAPALALGGHQKDAVAVAGDGKIVLGPHIGDLGSDEARKALVHGAEAMAALHGIRAESIACDRHPDYYSTHLAARLGPVVRPVPHHLAHALSGMVDNGLEGPVLAVAWDGTGHGGDGTIWGGEFLAIEGRRWRRRAHLLRFRLPGGEAAMREPRRAALGALHAVFGPACLAMTDLAPVAAFSPAERQVLGTMLERGVNAPPTSSAGRLFDAVAAILGLCGTASFEAQAAMTVEFAADRARQPAVLPPPILSDDAGLTVIDWRGMLAAMVPALRAGTPADELAAAFHLALAEAIVAVALRCGMPQVLLTGGCFQNARLTELAIAGLRKAGCEPYWHHRIPPNDGGLAVGQAVYAANPLIEEPA